MILVKILLQSRQNLIKILYFVTIGVLTKYKIQAIENLSDFLMKCFAIGKKYLYLLLLV